MTSGLARRPGPPLLATTTTFLSLHNKQQQSSSLSTTSSSLRRYLSSSRCPNGCHPRSQRLVSPQHSQAQWQWQQPPHLHQLVRGKKTRTTLSLDDLPQGPISPPEAQPKPAATRKRKRKQAAGDRDQDEDLADDENAAAPLSSSSSSGDRQHDADDGGGDNNSGPEVESLAEGEAEQGDGPNYPTVVMQARRNMQKFDNCVLLTRVGGFYELYFRQAEEYGPMLNLKVAHKKTNAGLVPMAGFPFFQLDRFLKTLVLDLNCYVAVAEEFPNDASDKIKSGGLMHDRRVTRIITPGTLIDENFIDPYANNYVMAVHVNSQHAEPDEDNDGSNTEESEPPALTDAAASDAAEPIGLAWLDLSTGQFYTQSTTLGALSTILSRVGPREIVVDSILEARKNHDIFSVLAEDKHLITFAPHAEQLPVSEWTPMLESEVPSKTVQAFTEGETAACSLLLQYVKNRLLGLSIKLQPPLRHENLSVLTIDKNSLRALEIKQTIRDAAFRGSLLHTIRKTVTKGGARLLNSWISAPSTSLDEISARQDLVDYFIRHEDFRDHIVMLLRKCHDSQRLVQKFAFGRGDADDMVALGNTIWSTQSIVQLLKEQGPQDGDGDCFSSLISRIRLGEATSLARRIQNSIDEDGLVQQHETEDNDATRLRTLAEEVVASEGTTEDAAILPKTAGAAKRKKFISIRSHYSDDNICFMMKPEASSGLQNLHSKLSDLMQEKAELDEYLREHLGLASLTLRWTPTWGHVGHVKGKDAKKTTQYTAVSSSRSTRALHIPEWTALGQRIHQTRYQISVEEQRIFDDIRALVVVNLVKLRQNAMVLDELDIATSFAKLAAEQGLVRPILNNGTAHTIIGGRHPTVEGGLREQGRNFTKNDCLVGTPGQGRLWLITGPNMAGKSTYLRQNALITILAQVGCFVPADHAELGIVDAIFSRVGSADDLYRDQSTFMVEMLETAQILRSATSKSLVIMDEVGRGTTPEDGNAVAFAALHHLVTVNKCRALFATHFHQLAELVAEHGMRVSSSSSNGDSQEHIEGNKDEDDGSSTAGTVEMYCTDIAEDGQGGFIYVHKLRKGINRQSHALKVAHLAGLPESAIAVARDILARSGKQIV